MLRLLGSDSRLCDRLTRREIMRFGGLSALGLSLPDLLGSQQAHAVPTRVAGSFGKAKSCIVLFLMGAPPQHSTWDPKPDAVAEVRGEIAPIATAVPGIHIGELMPRLARWTDKLAILRAVSTGDNAHSSSGYYMMTGRPHAPMNAENANPGPPNDWPNMGAILNRLTETHGELPTAVRLPMHIFNTDGSTWPGQDAGFLGRTCDPWLFRCHPAAADFQIPEFTLPVDVPLERLSARASLLKDLNARLEAAERGGKLDYFSTLSQTAFSVLSSAKSRAAFKLADEPQAVRDRYGMSQFGQSTLLARRLVEAGVRLVQVNWYRAADEPSDAPVWDTHVGETPRLKNVLMPPWDQAHSALLEDLHQRGLLDETLVVQMAEFGRTPKFNPRGGRDHWGPVFSISLAGGGIRGGTIYGASDKLAAYPKDGLVKPEDLVATIFHCLGYRPETEYHDPLGRPFAVSRGNVIEPILA
jgi:uncharacterized protein (DUF1501 family)